MKRKVLKIGAILCGIVVLVLVSICGGRYWRKYYREKKISSSKAVALKAMDLFNDGDTATARLVALCALPEDADDLDEPYAFEAEKTLRMVSAKGERILRGHVDKVNSVEYSPDDRYMVSASDDSTICLWDTQDYELEKTFVGHQGRVQYATFTSDGKYVVSYSNDDKSIIYWHIPDGQMCKRIDVDSDIKGFCLSNAGHRIAYSTAGYDIIVADDAGSQTPVTLKGHMADVHLLEFSNDDKYLFSASRDGTFRIWKLDTGEQIERVETHFGLMSSFLIGGNELLYLSINDSEIMFTIGVIGMELKGGHAQKVNCATFSSDGYCALSASDDKSVIAWRLMDDERFQLEVLMRYDGHTEKVNYAAFSHDGTHIASASDDHTVRVWEFLPLKDLMVRTKNELDGRELTPEELEKYGIKG